MSRKIKKKQYILQLLFFLSRQIKIFSLEFQHPALKNE